LKNKKELLIVDIMVILLMTIAITTCTSILNSGHYLQIQVDFEDYIYSTYLGGDDSPYSVDDIEDQIRDVATDSQENIIVTGNTLSSNFPIKNAFQNTFAGGENDVHGVGGDAFLAKFDNDGELLWSTYLGGTSLDGGKFVRVIESDRIIVLGLTKSSDFPTTDDAYQNNYSGNYDIFITKFSSNGSMLYSSYLGTMGDDLIQDFDLDSSGNLMIAGRTTSASFPVTTSADQAAFGGGETDGFFMRISANCSTILYSTFLGGSDTEVINVINIDPQGNIIVTGTTLSSDFPVTTNAFQSVQSSTYLDTFIAKYDPLGQMTYATYFGGSDMDFSYGLATDSVGNIIITGRTQSSDFPLRNAWKSSYNNGMVDGFITKFSADGQELIFSSYFGGTGWDSVIRASTDSNDNIIISGFADLYPEGFPILDGFQEEIKGRCDIVFLMISPNGQPLFGSYLGGVGIDHPWNHYLSSSYLYIVGFTESEDFLTSNDSYQQTLRGNHDGFLFRFDFDGYLNALTSKTTESKTTETTGSETTPSFEVFIGLIGFLSTLGLRLSIRGKK
jgi:hypothetical protein